MPTNTNRENWDEILHGLRGLIADFGVNTMSWIQSNTEARQVMRRQVLKAQLELARGYIEVLEGMLKQPEQPGKRVKKEKIEIK